MSADHLGELFREALGTSVKDFIRHLQVGVACRLLTEMNLTIQEVAVPM
ncbi:MAG: helix-turn-helix domain-containing protein [Candidatus Rokuibacteriota bacterium]